jgi:hypothetical protein
MLWNKRWMGSKHRKPEFTGDCKIVDNSSLQKLARAMRRGKVPDERQVIIDNAMASARRRIGKYHWRRPPQ